MTTYERLELLTPEAFGAGGAEAGESGVETGEDATETGGE